MNRLLPFLLVLLVTDLAVATAMADTNAPVVIRVGMLPQSEWQHPLVPGFAPGIQGFLDVIEGGNPPRQIILMYPRDMKPPTKTNTLVEVKGHLHMFQTEKPSNLEKKGIYKNEVIAVTSWRYVGPPP